MYRLMEENNRPTAQEAIDAVKDGKYIVNRLILTLERLPNMPCFLKLSILKVT